MSICSSLSWGMAYSQDIPRDCSAQTYSGSVCRQQLQAWQECAFGTAEDVFLDQNFMEQSQEEWEKDVVQFFHFLSELINLS